MRITTLILDELDLISKVENSTLEKVIEGGNWGPLFNTGLSREILLRSDRIEFHFNSGKVFALKDRYGDLGYVKKNKEYEEYIHSEKSSLDERVAYLLKLLRYGK